MTGAINLFLTVLFIVVVQANFTHSSIFASSFFVTHSKYDSKVFNVTGMNAAGGSLSKCSQQCLRNASCVSFAINLLPEENGECILYDINQCHVNDHVAVVQKDGYRIYDKMEATLGHLNAIACSPLHPLKECSVSELYSSRSLTGNGCPNNFTYNDGICYRAVANLTTYDDAHSQSAAIGVRLAKARGKTGLRFLASLCTSSGIEGFVYTSLVDVANDSSKYEWRWDDGTAVTSNELWRSGEPNHAPEASGAMMPPDYCWNDVDAYLDSLRTICQISAINKACLPNFQLYNETQTCYLLSSTTIVAKDASAFCKNIKASGVVIRNSAEWKFIVGLIKNSSYSGSIFSIGVSCSPKAVTYVSIKGSVANFNQWCPGQPDFKKETCAVICDLSPTNPSLCDVHCNFLCGYVQEWIASSCTEWYYMGQNQSSGVYNILPKGTNKDFQVYCDMQSEGGGWTVIQSKSEVNVTSFVQNLKNYNDGFGTLSSDFWLGLEHIYLLTSQERVILWLSFTDTAGQSYSTYYSSFSLSKLKNSSYVFVVETFNTSGGLSDEFSKQQNKPFTVDNKKGGWWFSSDSDVNLNGGYPLGQPAANSATAMQWSKDVLLVKATMKIRTYSECTY